jgi:hypothetical protein
MGGVQYLVHHAYEGKPKPVGADNFDRLLKYRDIRLKEEAKVRRRRRREARRSVRQRFFFCFFSSRQLRKTTPPALASFRLTQTRVPSEIAERTAHAVRSHAVRQNADALDE